MVGCRSFWLHPNSSFNIKSTFGYPWIKYKDSLDRTPLNTILNIVMANQKVYLLSILFICIILDSDWFQPETPTFSTCSLIIWYHKMAHKYCIPILIFQKSNIPIHNLLVELCTGIFLIYLKCIVPLQKACARFSFRFFSFSRISNFHFYIYKELTIWREISM